MEPPAGNNRDLEQRLFDFSVRIVRLCQRLDEHPGPARTLGRQLLRSGTSIGANYEEAQAGQSRADFISKTGISLKEARETHYWLRLLVAAEIVRVEQMGEFLDEADQIKRILGSIVSGSRTTIPEKGIEACVPNKRRLFSFLVLLLSFAFLLFP